jgi:hypothetical protein
LIPRQKSFHPPVNAVSVVNPGTYLKFHAVPPCYCHAGDRIVEKDETDPVSGSGQAQTHALTLCGSEASEGL